MKEFTLIVQIVDGAQQKPPRAAAAECEEMEKASVLPGMSFRD